MKAFKHSLQSFQSYLPASINQLYLHDNAVGSGVTSSFAHTFLLNGIIEESCRCCPVSVLIIYCNDDGGG